MRMDIDGMTFWVSSYGMEETMQRLRDAVRQQGMSVFGHIDHGQAAAAAGLEQRPLQGLVFGHALAGTKRSGSTCRCAPWCGWTTRAAPGWPTTTPAGLRPAMAPGSGAIKCWPTCAAH